MSGDKQFVRTTMARMALGYALLIVYGSLLPFHWNDLPFSIAWTNFQHIPLLQLGVGSRADLVANLLLYIPFGLLVCGWLVGESRRLLVVVTGMLLSLVLATGVALAVEFTQQFFAPRTVSLNDLFAELVGSALGILLWPLIGARLMHLAQTISHGGAQARHAVLIAYALAYAVLSIFPYDFLMSYDEWKAKLGSANVGWLFVPQCGGNCILRLIPEALLVAPLAMLVSGPMRRHVPLFGAAVAGAMLGVMIEGLQLTLASGISQGASVVSRAAGMMLGAGLIQLAPSINWRSLRQHARPALALGAFPYLGAVIWLNGWFSGRWLGTTEGWTRLENVNFLPFYYHYFSTETVALISLLSQAILYLPIGAGLWIWGWAGLSGKPKANYWWPAVAAGVLASVIEAGKLFVAGKHPDPTNILIAAGAATTSYWLLNLLSTIQPGSPPLSARPQIALTPTERPPAWAVAIGIPVICAATVAALTSPLDTSWVLAALLTYAALLWWQPGLWLACVPAMLPLLDLTQWSGRLFWTEFDTALLVTVGVTYLRISRVPAQRALRGAGRLLLSLFVLSAAISLVIGILPLSTPDHNAFSQYTSSYNALRVAKGLAFILAFVPLLALEWEEPDRAAYRLAAGITVGLAGTVGYILWERVTFPGLLNFENDYRITGPFPGMHVGGAYIEAYLTAALPFVALFAWQRRRAWATVLAVGLYSLGAYSVMVTFSRGGQAAFALATLVVLLGFSRLALREQAQRFSNITAVILFAGVAAVVAWPVLSGEYSQSRWASTERDLGTRVDHWAEVLDIVRMQNASFFGMGLGSFPSAYFWNSSTTSRPATYSFVTEKENRVLRLGSGDPLYFEQTVAIVPEQRYMLTMDLRTNARNATLTAIVCEKALLDSYTCTSALLQIDTPDGDWARHETQIHAKDFGPPGSRFARPIKLSIYNGQPGTVVDVDNVALFDAAGANLVRNGDFSSGMHYWFFSTDNYLPWHVENLYLNVFFEQGWLGLFCFLALITYAMVRWLSRALRNDPLSLVLCASFTAFLVVGMLNSWADEPRLSFFFYLLLIAGLTADARFVPTTPDHAIISGRS
ncbi:MAG: VanZ family protein [Nitrosospira sp.]|nr:VanZ family protein [Nitrosospira sp.]